MVSRWIALTSVEYYIETEERKRKGGERDTIHSLFVFMVRDRSDEIFVILYISGIDSMIEI